MWLKLGRSFLFRPVLADLRESDAGGEGGAGRRAETDDRYRPEIVLFTKM